MKKLLGLILLALAFTTTGHGQAISVNGGSIQGTITDASGAVVPNAPIRITGTETGFVKNLTSDSAGFYSVGPLNPGSYQITITAGGFEKMDVKTVVRTGTATSGNFKLTVGQSTETIEVNAGQLQVNTDQAGVSDVITAEQIKTLPVNGRNFLDLAQIEPGVILQSGETFDPTKAGYSAISVSGVSGRTTRILLDGQDITDETVGTTIFNVSQGAINEFQLNRSTQDVSGDVTSTGQVLVSTNSGTNAIHGQLFYQFQDQAALFANSTGGILPPFQRNQFGGSAGGPIIKDKLFIFGNAERIKQDSSAAASLGSLFQPTIGAQFPTISTPYRETYSTVRLDYNGPRSSHYFARINYNVNAITSNFGLGYSLYANRDNTPGIAGGADFATGPFTHSFRGSYEKFHNLISDSTVGNTSIYNPLGPSVVGADGLEFRYIAQNIYAGPNYLAPQGTYQSDKQFRYDGTWTKGRHNIKYGGSVNRILGGGFAAFESLAPRVTISAGSLLPNCDGVAGAAPCPDRPTQGYRASSVALGNGLGFFAERPGFGLSGGGFLDWRSAAYVADSYKITPSFTLTAGLRWSVDTDRANQDLTGPLCSQVDTTSVTAPCTGNTPLFEQFGSGLGRKVNQPYADFAPQIGFAYSPGSHKTVLRAGFGIFFESNVFNNTSNSRNALLSQGPFFDNRGLCGGTNTITLPGTAPAGGVQTTINGVPIATICGEPLDQAAPSLIAVAQQYQAQTRANSISANGAYVGSTLDANGIYAAPYRAPYSEQWNFGIQREVFTGGVLAVDYVHNSTLKIGQTIDVNRQGAARFFNANAARNAIATTTAGFGCSGGSSAAAVNCSIAAGATIADFAASGLDSSNVLYGGTPASYNGLTPDTGAAFPGQNPALGNGGFIFPSGRSGYDALQIVYRQQKSHPAPGIQTATFQGSYNLSRIVSNFNTIGGAGDQFFSGAPVDNDNPTQYIGRNPLDRQHQVSFGGSLTLKYGPQIGIIGHFYSAEAATLTLDNTAGNSGQIFQTDITGDGTVADVAPGTQLGDYQHAITGKNLNSYITNFNASQAGRLTPAGQVVANSGLLTPAQLSALGGTIQPIAQVPQRTALENAAFRNIDLNFSYPIRFNRFHEGLSLEPAIAFYNVFNTSNFNSYAGTLINQANSGGPTGAGLSGFLNGDNTFAVHDSNRIQRGSGTFDQGAPRTAEFQLKLNF